jgi:hypothetical protein
MLAIRIAIVRYHRYPTMLTGSLCWFILNSDKGLLVWPYVKGNSKKIRSGYDKVKYFLYFCLCVFFYI